MLIRKRTCCTKVQSDIHQTHWNTNKRIYPTDIVGKLIIEFGVSWRLFLGHILVKKMMNRPRWHFFSGTVIGVSQGEGQLCESLSGVVNPCNKALVQQHCFQIFILTVP